VPQVGYLPELYEDARSEKYKILCLIEFVKIRWVSAAVFLRLKQNLMQILYSLKSVILVVKKIARSLKHNLTKTH
jgi:hypothetical protein